MNYADAIVYLKENNITKDDGTFYEFGEVMCSVGLLAEREREGGTRRERPLMERGRKREGNIKRSI